MSRSAPRPPAVYIASPLGFADSSDAYRDVISAALVEAGLEPLDPWHDPRQELAKAFRTAERVTDPRERREALAAVDAEVGRRNHALVDRAHAVLAVLDGPDVDSGTAAEVGFAAARGVPVVGLRSDKRRTGENDGCIVNLQVEYFIRLHGGEVVRSLPKAVGQLRRLVRRHESEGRAQ